MISLEPGTTEITVTHPVNLKKMCNYQIVVTTLILSFTVQTITPMKQIKKSYLLSVNKNTFHTFDVRDGRLLYAKCKSDTSSNKKECLVVGEKTLGRSDTYSCNVTLNALRKKRYVGPRVTIKRFGSNKAILMWQETDEDYQVQHFTISILRLPSCKIADVRLDRETSFYEVFVIPYDNTVDVFFKHSKTCGDNMCRMIVNSRGKVVWGPISYFENPEEPYLLTSIDERSSDRGYFYVKRSAGETLYLLIRPNFFTGSINLFARMKGYPEIAVSTAHNMISACASFSHVKSSINCTQFDTFGKLKFKTTLDKPTSKAQMLFVQNPRQGGLLLGYEVAKDCDEDECTLRNYLVKYDVDGEKMGSKIERDSNGKWESIFEDDGGDICLFKSFDISSSLFGVGRHRMHIAHMCLNDTDFT